MFGDGASERGASAIQQQKMTEDASNIITGVDHGLSSVMSDMKNAISREGTKMADLTPSDPSQPMLPAGEALAQASQGEVMDPNNPFTNKDIYELKTEANRKSALEHF